MYNSSIEFIVQIFFLFEKYKIRKTTYMNTCNVVFKIVSMQQLLLSKNYDHHHHHCCCGGGCCWWLQYITLYQGYMLLRKTISIMLPIEKKKGKKYFFCARNKIVSCSNFVSLCQTYLSTKSKLAPLPLLVSDLHACLVYKSLCFLAVYWFCGAILQLYDILERD
jgi:hypothetical protein